MREPTRAERFGSFTHSAEHVRLGELAREAYRLSAMDEVAEADRATGIWNDALSVHLEETHELEAGFGIDIVGRHEAAHDGAPSAVWGGTIR